MLSRTSSLRRALVSATRYATTTGPRRAMAEAAAASEVDENKLKLNFFLPNQTLKKEAQVVRFFLLFILVLQHSSSVPSIRVMNQSYHHV